MMFYNISLTTIVLIIENHRVQPVLGIGSSCIIPNLSVQPSY